MKQFDLLFRIFSMYSKKGIGKFDRVQFPRSASWLNKVNPI
jgi:hypothetical protein